MGYFILDLFLFAGAVLSIFSGINKIWRPVEMAKRKFQKKKHVNFTEPSRKRVILTRIRGVADLLLAVFIIASLRFSIGWQEKPPVVMLTGDDTRHLPYEQIIASFAKDKNIPGMVVGIIDHNNILLYGYGYQDYTLLKKGRPVTAQTLFEIGSITKVFTGLMLAEAVQSGKLPLQMPVAELLEAQTQKRVLLNPEISWKGW